MAAPQAQTYPPNQTIYVHNIEERVKLDLLTSHLKTIFSQYGNVIDVVAKQSLKRRGQAFVVFDSEEDASKALKEVQGFPLFNRPIVLEFARTKSDAIVQLSGDAAELENHKRRRLAEKERKQAQEQLEQSKLQRPAAGMTGAAAASGAAAAKTNKTKGAGLKSTSGAPAVIPDEYLPPNKTLFVQNVPDDYDVDGLTSVFQQFEGFREVRLVPGRKGIAFVEYEAEAGAISAKERTANMPLGSTQQTIKVTYQRQ